MPAFIIFEYVLPNPDRIDSARTHGDDLGGGVVAAPYGSVGTPLEPAARPAYFDGKFLTASDLTDEQASSSDTGGTDMLLGDGSVHDISPRDAAFFAYDAAFLGGVGVTAGDGDGQVHAVVFAGDRYDPLQEQGIGGISVAVADIEAKGPHMLMTAGFMLG